MWGKGLNRTKMEGLYLETASDEVRKGKIRLLLVMKREKHYGVWVLAGSFGRVLAVGGFGGLWVEGFFLVWGFGGGGGLGCFWGGCFFLVLGHMGFLFFGVFVFCLFVFLLGDCWFGLPFLFSFFVWTRFLVSQKSAAEWVWFGVFFFVVFGG